MAPAGGYTLLVELQASAATFICLTFVGAWGERHFPMLVL